MTDKTEINEIEPSDIADVERTTPLQNFLIGSALGGFMSAIVLLFSLDFSGVEITDIGVIKPAIALAIALLCGVLSVKFKGSFFNALADTMSNLGS